VTAEPAAASTSPRRGLRAVPAWRWWVAGSFMARLPTTMVVIALVLSGKRLGSYGLGAALSGLMMLTSGLSALWRGRKLDRTELRRGIVGELVVAAGAYLALGVLVHVRAPVPAVAAVVVLAAVASSAVMAGYRSFLPDVVPPDLLGSAYAADAVLLEVAFVTGPAVAGGLALLVGPAGVLVSMGGLALVAAWLAMARLPERHPISVAAGDAPPPWSDPHAVANYLVTFAVGAMVGLLEAGFAPFADMLGSEGGVAGLLSAAYALGSGLGGVMFAGRISDRPDRGRAALILVVVLALLMLPIAAAPALPLLLCLLVLGGLPFATANAAGARYLQERVHPARVTEGFALATTAVLLGVAAGNGVASLVLGVEGSPRLIYVLGAVPPLVAVAGVALWSARWAPRRPVVDLAS
jgi:MFS family permease